jgi:hypothetical protein
MSGEGETFMTLALSNAARTLDRLHGRRTQLQESLHRIEQDVEEGQTRLRRNEAAGIIGRKITDDTREIVSNVFSSIGTAALRSVLDPEADFRIEFSETEGGRRRADLIATCGGVGGNVVDKGGNSAASILSAALRRSVIILHGGLQNLVAADEPLDSVDVGKLGGAAAMDSELVREHGMQLVVVSHHAAEEYASLCDVLLTVRMENGVSVVDVEDRRS